MTQVLRWFRERSPEREHRPARHAATTLDEELAIIQEERRQRLDEISRSSAEHEEKIRWGRAEIARKFGRFLDTDRPGDG